MSSLDHIYNDKAKEKMQEVIERFQAGDISPLVAVSRVLLPDDAPARKWSGNNRMLAYAQTGHLDCRGYRQWAEVGRFPKGQTGAYILYPRMVPGKDKNGEDKKVLAGFGCGVVFPYSATKPKNDGAFRYEPKEPPPLASVAKKLGIKVTYLPGEQQPTALGSVDPEGKGIALSTHSSKTFFHELAHAADARLRGKLEPGQHEDQEIRAELTACILSQMYGEDYRGNTWAYISHYAPNDPLSAIMQAANDVEDILEFILEAEHGKED